MFQIVAGNPENYLGDLPNADNYTVQVDVYATSPALAATGAQAIRTAVEPQAYVTSYRGQLQDPDTKLYRLSFDVDFITPRT